MAVLLTLFLLLAAMTEYSSAAYCVCKDGVSDQLLQKTLDYACGAGADCTRILQNGGCFQPNTVKNHCDYAVNSYFQRKGASGGTCDFSGTAALTNSPASSAASNCAYSSNPGINLTPTPPTTASPIIPTTTITTIPTTIPPPAAPTTTASTTTTPASTATTTPSSAFPGTTLSPSDGISNPNKGVRPCTELKTFLLALCFSFLTILRN